MLNNIKLLKEELDFLLDTDASYDKIYYVSQEIDKLLIQYYYSQDEIKELVLRK